MRFIRQSFSACLFNALRDTYPCEPSFPYYYRFSFRVFVKSLFFSRGEKNNFLNSAIIFCMWKVCIKIKTFPFYALPDFYYLRR